MPPCATPSRARPPKKTSHEIITAEAVARGRSSTAGPVPAHGVAGHQVGGRAERLEQPAQRHVLAERDPAHLVVAAGDLAVAASTITCALVKWSPASSVMPTAKGAPSRAASAATSASSGLVGEARSTSMTFSGQTTRSTGLGDRRVAARWRSNTSRGSVSMARVPCGPPPCTKATVSESPVSWPDGATAPSDEHHGDRGEHGCLAPRSLPRRSQRAAGEEGEPRDEDDAAQPGRLAQRAGGLADAQRRQRHATEGEDEADRLGHGEGRGEGRGDASVRPGRPRPPAPR